MFLHFILTKPKPTNILFNSKKAKNRKKLVKHPDWSCNYKQVSGSMMDGSVNVVGGQGSWLLGRLLKAGFFCIK